MQQEWAPECAALSAWVTRWYCRYLFCSKAPAQPLHCSRSMTPNDSKGTSHFQTTAAGLPSVEAGHCQVNQDANGAGKNKSHEIRQKDEARNSSQGSGRLPRVLPPCAAAAAAAAARAVGWELRDLSCMVESSC